MRRFLLALCAAFAPATARAEWTHKVDIVTSFDSLGYRAAKILADDGGGQFQAGEDNKARGEVRARFRILGSYLHLELEAYTVIPAARLMVNLAGLELGAYVPLHERLRLGYYHHSSHNFADGQYGYGIDLNALVADVLLLGDKFDLEGSEGQYQLRTDFRYFIRGRASPWLITDHTNVVASDTGNSQWRLAATFESRHEKFRIEGSLALLSPSLAPSSILLTAAGTFRLAPAFLGQLGEHIYIGPYFSLGGNFTRTDTFGTIAFVGGLRLDLLISEHVKASKK